jgi:Flp pilus assembly protein CpaB
MRGRGLALDLVLLTPLLVLALVGSLVEDAMSRQAQLANAIRFGVETAAATGPLTAETLGEIAAAIRAAAPKSPTGSQDLSVEMFCELPSGATARCADATAGQATHVAIRLTETWQPALPLPLLPKALPLQAGLTLSFR